MVFVGFSEFLSWLLVLVVVGVFSESISLKCNAEGVWGFWLCIMAKFPSFALGSE